MRWPRAGVQSCPDAPITAEGGRVLGRHLQRADRRHAGDRVHRLINSKTFYNQPSKPATRRHGHAMRRRGDRRQADRNGPAVVLQPVAGAVAGEVPFINAQARISILRWRRPGRAAGRRARRQPEVGPRLVRRRGLGRGARPDRSDQGRHQQRARRLGQRRRAASGDVRHGELSVGVVVALGGYLDHLRPVLVSATTPASRPTGGVPVDRHPARARLVGRRHRRAARRPGPARRTLVPGSCADPTSPRPPPAAPSACGPRSTSAPGGPTASGPAPRSRPPSAGRPTAHLHADDGNWWPADDQSRWRPAPGPVDVTMDWEETRAR